MTQKILLVHKNIEKVLIVRVRFIAVLHQVLPADLVERNALVQFLDCALQSFQTEDQDRDVVKGAPNCNFSQPHLDSLSRRNMLIVMELLALTLLVEMATWRRNLIWHFVRSLLVDPVPHHVNDLLAVHALENPIAPNQEEVKFVLKLEGYNLWLTNNDV